MNTVNYYSLYKGSFLQVHCESQSQDDSTAEDEIEPLVLGCKHNLDFFGVSWTYHDLMILTATLPSYQLFGPSTVPLTLVNAAQALNFLLNSFPQFILIRVPVSPVPFSEIVPHS